MTHIIWPNFNALTQASPGFRTPTISPTSSPRTQTRTRRHSGLTKPASATNSPTASPKSKQQTRTRDSQQPPQPASTKTSPHPRPRPIPKAQTRMERGGTRATSQNNSPTGSPSRHTRLKDSSTSTLAATLATRGSPKIADRSSDSERAATTGTGTSASKGLPFHYYAISMSMPNVSLPPDDDDVTDEGVKAMIWACQNEAFTSDSSSHVSRRSKDINSSQESLSSPALQRPGSRTSHYDNKDKENESVDGNSKDSRQRSPSHESVSDSRSGSPEKSQNTFERLGNQQPGTSEVNDSNNTGLLSPYVHKRYHSGGESFSPDLNHFHQRQGRERSFERSLDNILDRCTEKSLDLNLSVDSWSSPIHESSRMTVDSQSVLKSTAKSEKKKNRWYNNRITSRQANPQIINTSYKSRSDDFKRMFKDVPKEERLIVDYSCALQKDILVQGRMYISQSWICFYAKIFNWETTLMIPCREITAVTKEKTARVIPNAIQITTEKERFFFTSFGARDKTYMMLFRIWQNALLDQPMSSKELWTWIHYNYGDDLGLTPSDDDYEAPQGLEDIAENLKDDIALPSKEGGEGGDVTMGLGGADNHRTASNEDTDAALASDEVFNNSPSLTEAPPIPSSSKPEVTDFLDSSEDSEGEVYCEGRDHLEKMYLDEVFCINIDSVFQCLFTDSEFFRNFVTSRKTFDLNLPPWEENPDEHGNKVRNISYTLTLNNSIGPKTSPSIEKQTCYSMSRPGRIYHVDCECNNGGIPYADSFYFLLRYCLTRISPIKCRMVVTGELRYRKHVMGMFRGMIEKSAVNGLTDYCRQLSVHLRREAERQEAIAQGHQTQIQHPPPQAAAKKKVRRKRKMHPSVTENVQPSLRQTERQASMPPSPSKGREDRLIELNAHSLVRVIIVVLVLLLLFNAVLFYKLWSLESYASTLYGIPTMASIDNLAKHPRTQEEWSTLLLQQKSLHEREINKWEDVLSSSIHIVEQMKQSLVDLRRTLRSSRSQNVWEES